MMKKITALLMVNVLLMPMFNLPVKAAEVGGFLMPSFDRKSIEQLETEAQIEDDKARIERLKKLREENIKMLLEKQKEVNLDTFYVPDVYNIDNDSKVVDLSHGDGLNERVRVKKAAVLESDMLKMNRLVEMSDQELSAEEKRWVKRQKLINKLKAKGYPYNAAGFANAAAAGDMEMAKIYLDLGMDINVKNPFFQTALMSAAREGKTQMVVYLLSEGADPNIRNSKGEHALLIASVRDNNEIVKILMDADSVVDIENKDGSTSLFFAIANKNVNLSNFFIKRNANIHKANRFGITPLLMAARKNNALLAAQLLRQGADPDVRDINGNNAVLLAAIHGSYDVLKVLLESGASPNQIDRKSWTAIDLAIEYGYVDIANLLLAFGAKSKKFGGEAEVTPAALPGLNE